VPPKIILADLRDPDKIIAVARDFLDFTQPIGLLLVAILHFIPDVEDPAGIVAAFRDALPPGSFLALSHGTTDFHPLEVTGTAAAAYDGAAAPLVLRPRAAIERFLVGFTPEDPGLVQVPLWRPETRPRPKDTAKIGMYAARRCAELTVRPANRPLSVRTDRRSALPLKSLRDVGPDVTDGESGLPPDRASDRLRGDHSDAACSPWRSRRHRRTLTSITDAGTAVGRHRASNRRSGRAN
jgi:hypothetical protein